MDKALLLNHLRLAEKHVAESERLVSRQRELVEQLERDGHDIELARQLLQEFQHSLELHRNNLQRMRTELRTLAAGGNPVSS